MSEEPIIQMRPWAVEPFWKTKPRIMTLSWGRRSGKSFTMGAKGMRINMEKAGNLNTYISASIKIGGEFLLKEALVWDLLIRGYRETCAKAGKKLETSVDGLSIDDFCEVFEKQKLETRVWHTNTTYSRSIVVAANPDTAVGYGANLFIDEFGRIENFKDLLEAVLPFMDENPELFCMMASTPPPDDAHFSYELTCPPEDSFPVNPKGSWYTSKAGFDVHRVDAFDRYAAGFSMYDLKTGDPISPDQHREQAFDKTAWDRNNGVKYIRGGTSAVSMMSLMHAMEKGRGECEAYSTTEELIA